MGLLEKVAKKPAADCNSRSSLFSLPENYFMMLGSGSSQVIINIIRLCIYPFGQLVLQCPEQS